MKEFDKLLNYLYSLNRGDIKPGLERIKELLSVVGNPHLAFKSIHVAGTNGKGSVCSLLASILKENGLTVGLYTSPHIFKFNERIKINNLNISDEDIAFIYQTLEKKAKEISATFFEITTAIAFKYFEMKKVDIAVIETGLGGRFDATNVITPLASVITPISLEHCEYLGDNIKNISIEKAGIIKHNVPVVLMAQHPIATSVFLDKANKLNSEIYITDSTSSLVQLIGYTNSFKMAVTINFSKSRKNIIFPLCGQKQIENLQAVLRVVDVLRSYFTISDSAISRGIENVISNTGLKFRLECVASAEPTIIFDVAHNPDAMIKLVDTLYEVSQISIWNIVFGAMGDKNIKYMLEILFPICNELVIVQAKTERAADAATIEKIARKIGFKKIYVATSEQNAATYIYSQNFPTIVTGSFYTVSELAPFFMNTTTNNNNNIYNNTCNGNNSTVGSIKEQIFTI